MKLKDDKVVLVTLWWRTRGLEAKLYLFLNSALDGVEWSASSSGRFFRREEQPYPLIKRANWADQVCFGKEKHSPIVGFRNPDPPSRELSLCADCAIHAPYETNSAAEICFRIPSSNFCVSKEYYNRKYVICVKKESIQSAEHFVATSSSLQQGKELSKTRNFMRIVGTEYITFLFIFPSECF